MYWTERYFETQYFAGLIICIAVLAGVAIWGLVKLIMLIINKIKERL